MKLLISEKGYSEVVTVLGQLSVDIQKRVVKRAVRASLRKTLRQAKANVPVRSGALKKSLTILSGRKASGTDSGAVIVPVFKHMINGKQKAYSKNGKINSYYGVMVHYGTKRRKTKQGVSAKLGGKIVALGTDRGSMKANPFMLRAVDTTERDIAPVFSKELGVGIDQFLNKYYVIKK